MKKALEFTTASAEETMACGREIAKFLAPPLLLILRGDLGAGKTTLVKGIAEGLDAADAEEVTSPTYTLIHEYDGSLGASAVRLYHLDLYRIESERELAGLGLEDLAGPRNVALVEWGEKFASLAERSDGEIVMEAVEGDLRKIALRMKE